MIGESWRLLSGTARSCDQRMIVKFQLLFPYHLSPPFILLDSSFSAVNALASAATTPIVVPTATAARIQSAHLTPSWWPRTLTAPGIGR